MFNGTLGVYPHRKIHIELEEGAVPKHSRPYPVLRIHLSTFKKKELVHLVEIGVLAPQGESEWAPLSFITPKRMAEFAGSVIYVNLTKLLSTEYTLCLSSLKFYVNELDMSSLQNWTLVYNTIPLSLMRNHKISVPLSLRLESISASGSRWD